MTASTRAEEMLPVAEVARLWHCSKNHVYDLIAAGKLRSVNLARARAKTRVPASAMAEFVDRNARQAKSPAVPPPPPPPPPPPKPPPRPVAPPRPAGPKRNASVLSQPPG